jgi:hypothetical protein
MLQVLNELARTARKPTSLCTSVGARIFMLVCSHLSSLLRLDVPTARLSDVDIWLLSSNLPNLVELKYAMARDITINSLYYLKQLGSLRVLEFDTSEEHHAMILASVLHVLPHLKIAGARVSDSLCHNPESLRPHLVPMSQQPLALEHLVVTSARFSHNQAQVLPNLKALCVSDFFFKLVENIPM